MCILFLPGLWVEFWKVNFGNFLRVNFSGGPLLLEKTGSINLTREFGSKIWASKFVSQNSALNSGTGGAKSPVQTVVPDDLGIED